MHARLLAAPRALLLHCSSRGIAVRSGFARMACSTSSSVDDIDWLLFCQPDGRRPLAYWGPTLYTELVVPEFRACLRMASDDCKAAAAALDATDRHIASRPRPDGSRCCGAPQPQGPAPLPLRLPAEVARKIAGRQVLGDLLKVCAEGSSDATLQSALRMQSTRALVSELVAAGGAQFCISVHCWGSTPHGRPGSKIKMSSKSKHRLADACVEAAGLAGTVPRVGMDEASVTSTLFVVAIVHEMRAQPGDAPSCVQTRYYFGGRTATAATYLHSLHRFRVSERPFVGDVPLRPPLALAMSQLAFVRPDDLVLDPFVGSGTTLLAATSFGAHSIGVDNDDAVLHAAEQPTEAHRPARSSVPSMMANFRHLGLPPPDLVLADMLSLAARPLGPPAPLSPPASPQPSSHRPCDVPLPARSGSIGPSRGGVGCFDAIVTDPPFGLMCPSWRMGLTPAPSDAEAWELAKASGTSDHAAVHITVAARVLMLASALLKVGGRLVMLCPLRRDASTYSSQLDAFLAAARAAAGPEASCMVVEEAYMQDFRSFARHCVVMRRSGGVQPPREIGCESG